MSKHFPLYQKLLYLVPVWLQWVAEAYYTIAQVIRSFMAKSFINIKHTYYYS